MYLKAVILFFLSSISSPEAGGSDAYMPQDTTAFTSSLQELTVTALKQESSAAQTASAVTVIGKAEIKDEDIVSVKSISDLVPNLYVPDYGSRITSTIYLRGLGSRMDQPAVGLTVDNVPVLDKDAYDMDIENISSVEVLRGPQSTLYGRNTIAGQINISTLSPLSTEGFRVVAQGGTASSFRFSGSWFGKVSERTGLSAEAGWMQTAGTYRNAYDGRLLDHQKAWHLRTKQEWRVSDAVTLRNVLAVSGLRQGGYPYEYLETGEISYNDPCSYRRTVLTDGLSVTWLHDAFHLSATASVQHIDDSMTLDQDFTPLDYFTLTQSKRETAATLDGVMRSRGNGVYSWLAGAFLFYKHLDMSAPVTFKDTGIRELIENKRNGANPYYPIAWDERSFPLLSDFTIPTFGAALYHESSVRLGDWRLSAGIRLDFERASMDYRSRCNTSYTIFQAVGDGLEKWNNVEIAIDDTGRLHRSYFTALPKVTAMYDVPGTDCHIYANVSKGFKSGGFNTQMFSDVLQQRLMGMMGIGASYDVNAITGYKPEKSWNYELGAHLAWPAAALTADVALFYIDCRDQQMTIFPDGTTTGRVMANAGATRSLGAEAQLGVDLPAGFRIDASYGYTDARFRRYFDGIKGYRGKFIPYAPLNTAYLRASWECRLSRLGFFRSLTVAAGVKGAGRIYWNEDNSICQPFYILPDATVTLGGKGWSLQLRGRNLSDTRYSTFYFQSIGNSFVQRGAPRAFDATLRIEI